MDGLNNLLTGFFDQINNAVAGFGISDQGIVYVLGIFVLTLVLKTIVLPLYIAQQKSSIAMSKITPKTKALQEKYKNNPQKLQEEQLKLYKELGVNPLKGCLPALVQMPIFIAMFAVISTKDFSGGSFLWLPSLQVKDPLFILPFVTALVQYLSMKVMSRNIDEDQRKMQDKMAIMMAVVFVFFTMNYKAALAIYFIFSSIIQMVQGTVINNHLRKKQAELDAINEAKEKERLKREAADKAARREDFKKKKKKKADGASVSNKTSEMSEEAAKPRKKKKKRTDESIKPKSENKDGKVAD